MSDLFGAPSGTIAFHQDEDTQVATQERKAQIQHLGALTQQENMQTQVAGVKLQREKQMLQTIANYQAKTAGHDQFGDTSVADRMADLGSSLVTGGFFKEGGALVNQASEVKTREVTSKAAADRAKALLMNAKQKQIDDFHNLVAGSNDAQSFDAMKMMWMNEHPGETLPPEFDHYNPSLIGVLKKVAKTGQEETRRDQAAIREEDRIKARKEDQAERRRRDDMMERHQKALERYADMRESRQKKAGGKPSLTGATSMDVQAAQAMIMKDFPDIPPDMPMGSGKDSPLVSSAAYDLANESKALRGKNPALSMPEAMTQVFARMKDNGDFRVSAKDPTMIQKLLKQAPGKKVEYKAPKPEAAIPYVPGQTKPEKGKTYSLGGETWRLSDDGKKMVKVE